VGAQLEQQVAQVDENQDDGDGVAEVEQHVACDDIPAVEDLGGGGDDDPDARQEEEAG
jgi:hypothetical protein